ncbi:hypothetical protein LrDSM24759_05030 [Lactobacillus rodentium]|uniref:Uncharacterized protein n=1 Tax=Lactobacillus rodentium TaxID=947835 RepID=A0A2Z6TSA5_9LACO|nr:hypothetical protein LrDSM24759_05030 [Lactobacillus rodentium]
MIKILYNQIKKEMQRPKVRGSAMLSAILLLFACILFVTFYQEVFMKNLENNLLLLKYLNN